MARQKASKGLPGSASSKSREARYNAYRNEERSLHNQIARLIKLKNRATRRGYGNMKKYGADLESVIARSPIHVRTKYK